MSPYEAGASHPRNRDHHGNGPRCAVGTDEHFPELVELLETPLRRLLGILLVDLHPS